MATSAIPEHIDVETLVRNKDKSSLKSAITFLIVAPMVLYGIGRLIATQEGRIPTFIWVLLVISVLIGILWAWGDIDNKRNPEKDSRFRWPEIGTRADVQRAIEQEWNSTPLSEKERFGEYFITPSWLIEFSSMEFRPRPLRYVAWAYYSAKSRYVNGVPTGTTRRVMIHHVNGKFPWSIPVESDEQGTEFLFALRRRAPWAFYGYTEAYYLGWKNDPEGFIAAVKDRYTAAQAGQPLENSSEPLEPDISGTS